MRWPAWLGVGERRWKRSPDEDVQPGKTLWDVLQLLIVPVMLVVIALFFNAQQASRDRHREDQRIREDRALAEDAREDATLEAYLAQMRNLILDRNLLRAKAGSSVRQVARTATLSVLRRLDGARKGEVIQFLIEARLLKGGPNNLPVVDLENADLHNLDLRDATLKHFFIAAADIRNARFDRAWIEDGKFLTSNLLGSSFRHTQLIGDTFDLSDLRNVVFDGSETGRSVSGATTHFRGSCLTDASFESVEFESGGFEGTQGRDINFRKSRGLRTADVHDVIFINPKLGGVPPSELPGGWNPNGPNVIGRKSERWSKCFAKAK